MTAAFWLRRFLSGAMVLFIVVTLTFFFLRAVPGGPFDRDRALPEKIKANIEAKYGLDRPLAAQYAQYLNDILHGDLGPSFKYIGRSVNDILADAFPVSLTLGAMALVLALLIGLPAGVLSSLRPSGAADTAFALATNLGISLPSFVLAALLILALSIGAQWLPPALWEGPRYMVLPAITLGLGPSALIARLTRTSLLETLGEDYIRTARAKGLSGRAVLMRHALKNAAPPILTVFGLLTAYIITGSFIIEKVFAIPGMGKFFITAVFNRDYPLVTGATVLYAVLVLLANLLVDLGYRWLDPRVRLH